MPEPQAVIINTGMMTSVGLTANETVASVSADIMQFLESAIVDRTFDPIKLALVPDDALPDLLELTNAPARHKRMLKLATMPLLECVEPVLGKDVSLPLCLALPSVEAVTPIDGTQFLMDLLVQSEECFSLDGSRYFTSGRAGGLSSIALAAQQVNSGAAEFAIAGGVDSYLSLPLLAALDAEARIKSRSNLDGFIPGEGAGFVLVASRAAAETHNLEIMATISRVVEGREVGHLYTDKPYLGEGLAGVITDLLQDRDEQTLISRIFSSMNGERYWGKEWGVAYLRNQQAFLPEHSLVHPADCFGDIGAAAGSILPGLAARSDGPSIVYCSSDRGQRSALIVAA